MPFFQSAIAHFCDTLATLLRLFLLLLPLLHLFLLFLLLFLLFVLLLRLADAVMTKADCDQMQIVLRNLKERKNSEIRRLEEEKRKLESEAEGFKSSLTVLTQTEDKWEELREDLAEARAETTRAEKIKNKLNLQIDELRLEQQDVERKLDEAGVNEEGLRGSVAEAEKMRKKMNLKISKLQR